MIMELLSGKKKIIEDRSRLTLNAWFNLSH